MSGAENRSTLEKTPHIPRSKSVFIRQFDDLGDELVVRFRLRSKIPFGAIFLPSWTDEPNTPEVREGSLNETVRVSGPGPTSRYDSLGVTTLSWSRGVRDDLWTFRSLSAKNVSYYHQLRLTVRSLWHPTEQYICIWRHA